MPDRQAWEARLNSIWYSGRRGGWLRPLAALFGAVVHLRRLLYRSGLLRAVRASLPVVVVGNITVGGTGKTPLTIYIARRLVALGRRPGIATRGYGRAGGGAVLVRDDSTAEEVGDEALLLQRRAGVPVCVARRRVEAAAELAAAGCDIILCDDGLQHLALNRDLEIAVVDGERGLGNGRLLPAGPLREPAARLDTVDLVVVNSPAPREGGFARAGALAMRLRGTTAVSLADASVTRPLSAFGPGSVHAVAAIGNPGRFFSSLREAGLDVLEHAFPDHHRFRQQDLRFDDGFPVIMTEKDAVKYPGGGDQRCWYLPVDVEFGPADDQRLMARIAALPDKRGTGT